ncbi:small integral membrane protein 20 [Dermatophagoides farinae]|uniref:Small integral membrane protein 20 n=1 Tax=Dermatophagoides farinae TaxID=6954 RepID=A0A922L6F6_DERFA|nr:small integral membrane protein 20-like [Dermatophagoides farinae]KAH7644562.1 hypothetical protein HUG17_0100 [Dermatophagoides farinae]KAH9511613.1 protein of unknown function (DUF4538) [Dermatophagoides farinae]
MKRSIPLFSRSRNGYKGALIVAGFVGTVLIALYPIFIYPYFNIEKYQKTQHENRKGINREEIQPGNMRVWSDPFIPRSDQ